MVLFLCLVKVHGAIAGENTIELQGEFGHYRCWKIYTGEYLGIFDSTEKIVHDS